MTHREAAIAVGVVAVLIGVIAAVMMLSNDDTGGAPLDQPMSWPPGQVTGRNNLAGVRPELLRFMAWWNVNGPFPLRVTSGFRTDAQQAALYAQGRSTPGQIVTYAKTASDSAHGRAAAIDAYPFDGSKIILDMDDPRWATYGAIAQSRGLAWGGTWSRLMDKPHVEVPGWQSFPVPDAQGYV